jgi:hypothetical protein
MSEEKDLRPLPIIGPHAKCLSDLCLYYGNSEFTPINPNSELKEVVEHNLSGKQIGKRTRLEIEDTAGILDYGCILDASGYLDKSVYSLLASKFIQSGGYESWSIVMRYYSRFYSIIAMLAMQGVRLFHLKGRQLLLSRSSLNSPGHYSIVKPRLKGGGHKFLWNLFQECFSDYQISENEKRVFSLSEEPFEVEFRDSVAYSIYPGGFAELYAPSLVGSAKYQATKNFLDDSVFYESESLIDIGIEENLAGATIHQTLIMLSAIIPFLKNNNVIKGLVANWSNRLDLFDVNAETKVTLKSWIIQAVEKVKKS